MEGKQQQFIAAYDEFSDSVYRHCVIRVSNRDEAVDIMQETFMRTWDYMQNGGKVRNMKAFIFRVANNLIIDWYRKKKPVLLDDEQAVSIPDEEHSDNPEKLVEHEEILAFLKMVDEPYRTAITLRFVEGFAPKEIAKILGESENTISVRVHRGLKKLRECFEGVYGEA